MTSRNLGTGGLILNSEKDMPVGTRVQIRVTLESIKDIDLTADGRVVWTNFNAPIGQFDVGICFVGLDPLQRKNVLALIGVPNEMMSDLEQRHFIRLRRRTLVDYRASRTFLGRWRAASAHDISLGGVALVLHKPLDQAMELLLRIHLDDSAHTILNVQGYVLERGPIKDRVGEWMAHVRFNNAAPETLSLLATYISHALTSPLQCAQDYEGFQL